MHTPGPWNHVLIKDGWDGVKAEDGTTICNLVYNNPDNATLIAGAPDLLEAAQGLVDIIGCLGNGPEDIQPDLENLKQAIAKAKGE